MGSTMGSVTTGVTNINGTCSATSLFITLVFSAITRKSKVTLKETLESPPNDVERYDFIIVGGGSAGSVLANRLTENHDWTVLLLEAGQEQPEESHVPALAFTMLGTNLNWNYTAEPQAGVCNDTRCSIPRGKGLGGSSSVNVMIYVRGNKEDYDDWAGKFGNKGWSYEEVLPYFKKSENNADPDIAKDTKYHGTGGYLSVERMDFPDPNAALINKGFLESGLEENKDCNGKTQNGVTYIQTTTLNGERDSANTAFLKPARDRPNLKVLTRAHVSKVLIDRKRKSAVGVEYLDVRSAKKRVFARKEVILCGGTINTPQILMLSGIGPKEHLEEKGIEVVHDLPGVGLNYHDHVSAEGVYFKLGNTTTVPTLQKITEDEISYLKYPIRTGPLASIGPTSTAAFMRSKYQHDKNQRPDLQVHFVAEKTSTDDSSCNSYGNSILCYYDKLLAFPIAIGPKSRGKLLLNTTNPLDHPLIYQNLTAVYDDVKVVIEGMKFLAGMANTTTFKDNNITLITDKIAGCEDFEFASDEYWGCAIRKKTYSFYHPVGTCKMSPSSDKEAVVDEKLKVHGIENLRVGDASAMPQVPSGNTNAPTIMVAEKLADMIKDEWMNSGFFYDLWSFF